MKTNLRNIVFKTRNPSSLFKPIIIAHRGASGYEPENTLLSFRRALEMGCQAIELDVFLTHSGEIVVIHDETINRTTNGTGYVSQFSIEQLKSYNAGKGEKIPLLSETFDLIEKAYGKQIESGFILNIELKEPRTARPVADLIKYYLNKKKWDGNNFIVSSFDHQAIQEFQHYLPDIKTGAIFFRSDDNVIEVTQQSDAQYIILDYQSITYNLIAKAHKIGLFIFVYTVNDPIIAQELATWHIDGIITDFPDILNCSESDPNILH